MHLSLAKLHTPYNADHPSIYIYQYIFFGEVLSRLAEKRLELLRLRSSGLPRTSKQKMLATKLSDNASFQANIIKPLHGKNKSFLNYCFCILMFHGTACMIVIFYRKIFQRKIINSVLPIPDFSHDRRLRFCKSVGVFYNRYVCDVSAVRKPEVAGTNPRKRILFFNTKEQVFFHKM